MEFKRKIYKPSNLTNSDVERTLTKDCSFKCESLDQMEALSDNASAKYGASLGSGKFLIALSKNSSYSDSSENSMFLSTSVCLISNSCLDNPDLETHDSLYLSSSNLINSGAKNSALIDENKYAETELGFIMENKELLSNTNFILDHLYSLLFSGGIAFSNSPLLLGETSESSLLKESFFAFLPSSTLQSIRPLSFSSLFNNSSFKDISSVFSIICFLIKPLQLISENFSIFFFTSSGIDKVTLTILKTSNYVKKHNYVIIYKTFGEY